MTTKSSPVRSFTTSVDIAAGTRTKVNGILNQHLADSFDLMSQVKQAHWNVKGSDFWQVHKLFDEVAARASEWVDELAERITAPGGRESACRSHQLRPRRDRPDRKAR